MTQQPCGKLPWVSKTRQGEPLTGTRDTTDEPATTKQFAWPNCSVSSKYSVISRRPSDSPESASCQNQTAPSVQSVSSPRCTVSSLSSYRSGDLKEWTRRNLPPELAAAPGAQVGDATYRRHMVRAVKQITGNHYCEMRTVDILRDFKEAFQAVSREMLEQATKAEQYPAAFFRRLWQPTGGPGACVCNSTLQKPASRRAAGSSLGRQGHCAN